MRAIITLFAFLYSILPALSQSSDERLQAFIIVQEEDSLVRIRWAPANMKSWYWGIENGYRLSRYTVALNGVTDSLQGQFNSLVILDSLILPIPENIFDSLHINASGNAIGIAKAALYEESFVVDSMIGESDLARAYAHQSDREARFIYGLFGADQKFDIAEAMGLGYMDTNVDSQATYFYRIEFLGDVDSSDLSANGILVDLREDAGLPVPGIITMEMGIDTNLLLSWDVIGLEDQYVSYNIEKSDDSISFNRVNELPLIPGGGDGINESQVYFSDDVNEVGAWYYYRVRGMTSFGIEGPPSPVLKAKTTEKPKASPPKITNIGLVADDVEVEWSFPSNEEQYISEFRIYRSGNAIGPFELLDSVAVNIRIWTDEEPLPSGYYRITAHDLALVEVRAGDKLIQLNDTIPPDIPTGLNATINSSGEVTVIWASVLDTGLKGYRVYSGNSGTGNFAEETNTPVEDTTFVFTTNLKTLTDSLFIKVQAVDIRENVSGHSLPCVALRPDVVPPSKPLLFKYNPLSDGIFLEWKHSASEDLVEHQIQRKKTIESEWEILVSIDAVGSVAGSPIGVEDIVTTTEGGSLSDTSAVYPYDYQYRVLALDEANNTSSSDIHFVRPFDSGLRGIITNFALDSPVVTSTSLNPLTAIKLSWDYSQLQGLYDFQIYRSADGKPMRAYATTNGRGGINFEDVASSGGTYQIASGEFTWKDAKLGNAFMMAQSGVPTAVPGNAKQRKLTYKVMARHFDGGWSEISDAVTVNVWVPGN